MTTIIEPPGQRALHLPALLHDLKPLAGVLDDLQVHFVSLLSAAFPVAQPLGLLATVDPDVPEPGHPRGAIPFQ